MGFLAKPTFHLSPLSSPHNSSDEKLIIPRAISLPWWQMRRASLRKNLSPSHRMNHKFPDWKFEGLKEFWDHVSHPIFPEVRIPEANLPQKSDVAVPEGLTFIHSIYWYVLRYVLGLSSRNSASAKSRNVEASWSFGTANCFGHSAILRCFPIISQTGYGVKKWYNIYNIYEVWLKIHQPEWRHQFWGPPDCCVNLPRSGFVETSDEPWTSVTPAASRLFFEPKASPSDAASNVAAVYCWKETRMITPITASSYFQYSSRKILGHDPTSAQAGYVQSLHVSSSNIQPGTLRKHHFNPCDKK